MLVALLLQPVTCNDCSSFNIGHITNSIVTSCTLLIFISILVYFYNFLISISLLVWSTFKVIYEVVRSIVLFGLFASGLVMVDVVPDVATIIDGRYQFEEGYDDEEVYVAKVLRAFDILKRIYGYVIRAAATVAFLAIPCFIGFFIPFLVIRIFLSLELFLSIGEISFIMRACVRHYIVLLLPHITGCHIVESQLNGNNGSWTNADDHAAVLDKRDAQKRWQKNFASGGGGKSKVKTGPLPPVGAPIVPPPAVAAAGPGTISVKDPKKPDLKDVVLFRQGNLTKEFDRQIDVIKVVYYYICLVSKIYCYTILVCIRLLDCALYIIQLICLSPMTIHCLYITHYPINFIFWLGDSALFVIMRTLATFRHRYMYAQPPWWFLFHNIIHQTSWNVATWILNVARPSYNAFFVRLVTPYNMGRQQYNQLILHYRNYLNAFEQALLLLDQNNVKTIRRIIADYFMATIVYDRDDIAYDAQAPLGSIFSHQKHWLLWRPIFFDDGITNVGDAIDTVRLCGFRFSARSQIDMNLVQKLDSEYRSSIADIHQFKTCDFLIRNERPFDDYAQSERCKEASIIYFMNQNKLRDALFRDVTLATTSLPSY